MFYLRLFIIFLSISLAVVTAYIHRDYLGLSVHGFADRGGGPENAGSSSGGKGGKGWMAGMAAVYEGIRPGRPSPAGSSPAGSSPAVSGEALSKVASMHADLGRGYEKAGVYNEAFSEYSTALKYNPSDILIRRKVEALLDLLTRETDDSVKGADRLKPGERFGGERTGGAKLAPARADARGVGADRLASDYTTAVEELNRVLRLVPSHMDAKELVHLSERAATERKKAVVESHQQKGIDYFLADDMEAAIKVWDAVLKLDPGNKTAVEYKKRAEMIVERLKEINEKKTVGKGPM